MLDDQAAAVHEPVVGVGVGVGLDVGLVVGVGVGLGSVTGALLAKATRTGITRSVMSTVDEAWGFTFFLRLRLLTQGNHNVTFLGK